MKTKLRKIGNSYGVLLNRTLLENAKIKDEIIISSEDNKIIIEAYEEINPRKNWEQMLLSAGSLDEKPDEINELSNDFDNEKWTW